MSTLFHYHLCVLSSHGQLGHEGLGAEEEPRVVEALLGVPISCVTTGGWHSACISGKGHILSVIRRHAGKA